MAVYVDTFQIWAQTKIRCFKAGSCHMTADTLDELHAMARKIGLKRIWFQEHPRHPHYDLTESRRTAALAAGAVFIEGMAQMRAKHAGMTPLEWLKTHPEAGIEGTDE